MAGLADLTLMEKPTDSEVPQRQRGGFRGRGRGGRGGGGDRNREQDREQGSAPRGGRGGRGGFNRPPPPVRLFHDEKDIKLNEAQQARVKELEEEIKKIGNPVRPDEEAHNRAVHDLEMQIGRTVGQIDVLKQKIETNKQARDQYLSKNAPEVAEREQSHQKLRELKDEIAKLFTEKDEIKQKLTKIQSGLKERQLKSGVKSREEAELKRAEIEERIETETLTNQELKKLMSDVDRLTKIAASFDNVESQEAERMRLIARQSELGKLIDQKREERDGYVKKLEAAKSARAEVTAALTKFREAGDALWKERKTLEQQNKERYDAKAKLKDDHHKAVGEYLRLDREKRRLERDRKLVYAEAEKIMEQIEEGRRKIGEITERQNPHQKELSAGMALIGYLEGLVESEEEAAQSEKPMAGKQVDAKTMALLASIHKGKKKAEKGKKQEKKEKKEATLVHSMDTMAQFVTVEVQAPTTIAQAKECIEVIRKKCKGWKETFVKALVKFDFQADGKVRVAVVLE